MPVLYEQRGAIGLVTLSRPESRNCWGEDFAEGLLQRFNDMAQDDSIHCAILTGDEAGQAFCAGANLKDPNTHTEESAATFIKSIPKFRNFVVNVLHDFPKPVIAAVNGYAIGVGCIMTFCCDLVVASDQADWRLTQSQIGILPAYGATARLARWIGKANAMKLSLGFPIKAEEALRNGLAQWVVPHASLMQEAFAIAEHIAVQPPLAPRLVKESMNNGLDIPNLAAAALADVYRFMALELTDDKAEGHAAWRERRQPHFQGR
jgi:enoyl-CoA hydratase/carnithine racemase